MTPCLTGTLQLACKPTTAKHPAAAGALMFISTSKPVRSWSPSKPSTTSSCIRMTCGQCSLC